MSDRSYLTVTGDPLLGEEYAWLPGCPECGPGVVMVASWETKTWSCCDCDARFSAPDRKEVPERMKIIAKVRAP